ncbi:hypothetical protein BCR44DRAFT_1464681, partial [Catenaria anguillulae PL171]
MSTTTTALDLITAPASALLAALPPRSPTSCPSSPQSLPVHVTAPHSASRRTRALVIHSRLHKVLPCSGTLAPPAASRAMEECVGCLVRQGQCAAQIERIAHVKEDGVRRGLLKPGEEPGLFAVWMLGRWAVGVNNPQDLKDVWTEHSTFEKFRPQKDLADGST